MTLDGVLMKCNRESGQVANDTDCLNARIAIERLARKYDPAVEAKRKSEFERSREQLRLAQEKQRQEQEAKKKVDAYTLPVVPVEPAQPPPSRFASVGRYCAPVVLARRCSQPPGDGWLRWAAR